jgi:RNA polymerase sigma-54 factor
MNAIMHYQEEFLDGDETKLKPMILKDIADLVGLDISTVSRVANSKYVRDSLWHKVDQRIFSEAMKMIKEKMYQH